MTDSAVTTLTPELAEAKTAIEGMMHPDGPYWRGPDAATLQQNYRDLVRAELAGQPEPVGPEHSIDPDLPLSAAHYDLTGLPMYTGEDRAIADLFLMNAFSFGIGQRKAREAINFALTHHGPTTDGEALALVEAWRKFAMSRGFSDEEIEFCEKWAAAYEERGGLVPAQSINATPTQTAAEERASIESIMGPT